MSETLTAEHTIIVSNNLADCEKIFSLLETLINKAGIPQDIHHDLKLAIEETFTNIVSYAFDDEARHDITLQLNTNNDHLGITFIDDGLKFDPLSDCDKSLDPEALCDGGMGIHIIRSLSDHQEYNRVGQTNVFTVTKHYTK